MNRGTSWGWGSQVILGLFAFSACALASFLRVESRAVSPVIALGPFKVRSYAVGVSSLALNFAGQSAVTFLMPFYLQQVRGYSTGQTGLVIATVPSMMLLLSPISGRVSDRFGFRHQTTAGIVLVSFGLLLMSTIDASTPIGLVMARLAVIGVGTSIFMSPNSASIMGSVPKERLGTASASVATARNIGNATGLAMASERGDENAVAILPEAASPATVLAGTEAAQRAGDPKGFLPITRWSAASSASSGGSSPEGRPTIPCRYPTTGPSPASTTFTVPPRTLSLIHISEPTRPY